MDRFVRAEGGLSNSHRRWSPSAMVWFVRPEGKTQRHFFTRISLAKPPQLTRYPRLVKERVRALPQHLELISEFR